MKNFLDRTTLLIIASAFIMVLLCISTASRDIFPFWVIRRGAFVGDALFHEMGHTLFYWLFGQPAIPMIFTFFGSDQAGGMSMPLMERNWFMQIAMFAVLAYGCYWVRKNYPKLFIATIIFSLLIFAVAFTRYTPIVIAYMGHGSSILVGGFLLFRTWIYLDARNQYERWLNAFLGFYLILSNLCFSYNLAFNPVTRGGYDDHIAFGASHNDFWMMAMEMPGWSVKGIAIFTIGYCLAAIIGSFILAMYLNDAFEE